MDREPVERPERPSYFAAAKPAAEEGDATVAPASAQTEESRPEGEEPQRREKRSRDRYGRDRKDRAPRDPSAEPTAFVPNPVEPQAQSLVERAVAPVASVVAVPVVAEAASVEVRAVAPVVAVVAESPVVVVAPVAPASAAVSPKALPAMPAFSLPTADLVALAQNSGLEWVGSNPDRVAAVQAAIAAEPVPAHVPRERPPVVEVSNEPLVLVETKRDLRNLDLPF